MKIKFRGNLLGLKKRVTNCGVLGRWRYIAPNGLHQFQSETGENLNWWPTTGTISFQGGGISVLRDRYESRYLPQEVRRATRSSGKSVSRRQ